jgi:hypothetical protein
MSNSRVNCAAKRRVKAGAPDAGASSLDQEIVALGAELTSMDEQKRKKQRRLAELQTTLAGARAMVVDKTNQIRVFAAAIPELDGQQDPLPYLDALVDMVDGVPPVMTPAQITRQVSVTRAWVTDLEKLLVCDMTTPSLAELEAVCTPR